MIRLVSAGQRLRWLNLPSLLLLALLQRGPALRVALPTLERAGGAPLGQLLRAATTAAALGAVHTLAGATTVTTVSANPLYAVIGVPVPGVSFELTGVGVSVARSWQVSGSIPPGCTVGGLADPGTINTTSVPALSGTPTAVGTFIMQVQAWQGPNRTQAATSALVFTVVVSATATAPPVFTTQPAGGSVAPGTSVTLSAVASGVPSPTYQWRKDAAPIPGATLGTLTLASAQAADAGSYDVIATNSLGSVRSAAALLTVGSALPLPVFTLQPQPLTIASGGTAVFSCAATGTPAYQWQRDGAAIAGATGATLVVRGAEARAGSYRVVAGTAPATSTSNAAILALSTARNFGHLTNLSILTAVSESEPYFTVGTVVGGAAGAKPLLIRAAGPALGALGVSGVLGDPKLELFAGASSVARNDNWGGGAQLRAAAAAVGAFPFANLDSTDAAFYDSALPARDYTVQVGGAPGTGGAVIAELYDATPAAAFSAATPRLVNVSVLKRIDAGATLTAGFVLGGETARTVLIRAIGPGLGALGAAGTMPDPRLALFNQVTTAKLAANDDWGGDPQLSAVGTSVGAFEIRPATSKDAMLLLTLAPGNYTAEVSAGTTGGLALVEVYEVP